MNRRNLVHKSALEHHANPIAGQKCYYCSGTGRCWVCNGTGDHGGQQCGTCWGTGKCKYCDGTGIYMVCGQLVGAISNEPTTK